MDLSYLRILFLEKKRRARSLFENYKSFENYIFPNGSKSWTDGVMINCS